MKDRYEHTQIGYAQMAVTGGAIVISLLGSALLGFRWLLFLTAMVCAALFALFSTLTVIVEGGTVELRFGRGFVRRRLALSRVRSCRVAKIPPTYLRGIRTTKEGWVFSVSGDEGVELQMDDGKTVRIGTDAPKQLEKAIRKHLGEGATS